MTTAPPAVPVPSAPRHRPDGSPWPDRLWRDATAVLAANWSHDHTVPSRRLYPHQWSWDSAFISIGLAHTAPDRAWQDLRALFAAQWPDGRVPHIVFDRATAERDYFPGPAFWAAPAAPGGTTGLVQPPLHALAAWAVYRTCADRDPAAAGRELAWLYPRLVAQQDYLADRRDTGGAGLVSIVHPWESGLDNSPAWDDALAAVPADGRLLRRYQRRDVQVADAAHRPTDVDYARYIALAAAYRDTGYDDSAPLAFRVECPAVNSIYASAEQALARIAVVLGADPAPHHARAAAVTEALTRRLYDPDTGMFHALDVLAGARTPARCVSGVLPLMLPGLPADVAATLLAQRPVLGMPYSSYDRTAADFDPLRYWRGPVWINVNWLLWRAARDRGLPGLAGELRSAMLGLVTEAGFYEYYHPDTGAGIGAPAFSWTAALTLDLLAHP
ncbi:MAG TPA: hypothetical protein VES42_11415 [Pilimelia sp.]|nr:hypothetical protein [Pilimelia sp.]